MLFWALGTVLRPAIIAAAVFLVVAALWAQRPFREVPGVEYERFPLPKDYREPAEWTFARMMYPPVGRYYGGFAFFGSWKAGGSNWTMDYPRSDRHLSAAVRRLTRISARSAEQIVDLDDKDVYDWPWLYAVETGHWDITEEQARTLREYIDRGGFLMTDDFHGAIEWEVFVNGMKKVFPDRPIVEIESKDAIFHILYDLDDRYQVPGALYLETGLTYEKGETGKVPHWRGIYDEHGRLVVVICHNMDLGDSWEHADNPEYPEKFSALGIRIAMNYITYSMTH
jgi:hypothetical protein